MPPVTLHVVLCLLMASLMGFGGAVYARYGPSYPYRLSPWYGVFAGVSLLLMTVAILVLDKNPILALILTLIPMGIYGIISIVLGIALTKYFVRREQDTLERARIAFGREPQRPLDH